VKRNVWLVVFVNLNLREEEREQKTEKKGQRVAKQLVVFGPCHCGRNN